MTSTIQFFKKTIQPAQFFMLSSILVNGGNYLYNLIIGRILGPETFADAALLITMLLVLSFVAMTIQLVTAKFSITLSEQNFSAFLHLIKRGSILIGSFLGLLVIVSASKLQQVFHTKSSLMFVIFGFSIPIYFIMSMNRGLHQGKTNYYQLSFSYQLEMFSRLFFTVSLLLLLDINTSITIALAIFISVFCGLFPFEVQKYFKSTVQKLDHSIRKQIINFLLITAFYELTLILINNSDILLVKHFFRAYEAGLYASLALIGRVVYFIAWMFIMLLLPDVITKHKNGESTLPTLFKYLGFVGILAFSITFFSYLFAEEVVFVLFGDAYISISFLLWKYALATSLFAMANIFTYYFLSLENYIPIYFTGIFGAAQVLIIYLFHSSLLQVVDIQIGLMCSLLIVQFLYFIMHTSKQKMLNETNKQFIETKL